MPKVSIIVPVYNVERYLRECIDSALAQTYQDYELILVDDGSPDNSGAICDEYAEKDSRIRVIHKKNGGLSDARNAGLDAALGEYICFLDSDDSVSTDLLERVIPQMEAGYDLVTFSFQGFYDDGTVFASLPRECADFFLDSAEKRKEFIHSSLMQYKVGWEAWSRIYVREVIETNHLRFEDNRKILAEDVYFNLCYCAHAERIKSTNACLYNYRQRPDSIMHQETGKNNIARIHQLALAVQDHYRKCDDCSLLLEDFDYLYFQILMSQFIFHIQYITEYEVYRTAVIESLPDWEKIHRVIKDQLSHRKKLKKHYSRLRYYELVRNAEFLLGGAAARLAFDKWLIQRIRNQRERLDNLRAKLGK